MEFNQIVVSLLIAHFLGDFLLQPKTWVKHKEKHRIKSKYLYLHVFIHGILAYVFLSEWYSITLPLIVIGVHYLIDLIKLYKGNNSIWFIVDQVLHILSILVMAVFFASENFSIREIFEFASYPTAFWLAVLAYIIVLHPTSIFINQLTQNWQKEIDAKNVSSLKNAGKWIGMLERILILTFILSNHFMAVGFLLAAKSIFRFGDLTHDKDRKLTEYVLIGTLLSFTITILLGLIITTI